MTVLKDKTVKIRKQQQCFGCGRKFEKGNILRYLVQVDDGFNTTYWCNVCDEYWNKYMDNGDEINMGDLRVEDYENWEEIRKQIEDKL